MTRQTECKWCGAGREKAVLATETFFACGSCIVYGDWGQSAECEKRSLRDRIQRAVDTLKAAKRYTVTPGPRNTLDWDRNPDGSVTDSAAVDEALAILEGERDEAT